MVDLEGWVVRHVLDFDLIVDIFGHAGEWVPELFVMTSEGDEENKTI